MLPLRTLGPLAALLVAASAFCPSCDDAFQEIFENSFIRDDDDPWSVSVTTVLDGTGSAKQSIVKRVGADVVATSRSRESPESKWVYHSEKGIEHQDGNPSTQAEKPHKLQRGLQRGRCGRRNQQRREGLTTHAGFSVGDLVDVQVLHPPVWNHRGHYERARIHAIERDGRFSLMYPEGGSVTPALHSGIRHWHLRAVRPVQHGKEGVEPGKQGAPACGRPTVVPKQVRHGAPPPNRFRAGCGMERAAKTHENAKAAAEKARKQIEARSRAAAEAKAAVEAKAAAEASARAEAEEAQRRAEVEAAEARAAAISAAVQKAEAATQAAAKAAQQLEEHLAMLARMEEDSSTAQGLAHAAKASLEEFLMAE